MDCSACNEYQINQIEGTCPAHAPLDIDDDSDERQAQQEWLLHKYEERMHRDAESR